MRIETFGKDVEVTPALKEYVETKLQRLGKHFDQHCEVRVTLSLQKNEHHVDASANLPGQTQHVDGRQARPAGHQVQGEAPAPRFARTARQWLTPATASPLHALERPDGGREYPGTRGRRP